MCLTSVIVFHKIMADYMTITFFSFLFLVVKIWAVGFRGVVFVAKPGKKPATWHAHVVHPKWQLSDQAAKCLERMKALYEVLIAGQPIYLQSFILIYICNHNLTL